MIVAGLCCVLIALQKQAWVYDARAAKRRGRRAREISLASRKAVRTRHESNYNAPAPSIFTPYFHELLAVTSKGAIIYH